MSSDALPLLSIRGVGKTYAQPVLAEIDPDRKSVV